MKYLFIFVFVFALLKFFVFKNVKNKIVFIIICATTILFGVLNFAYDLSFADLLKRWM